MPPSRDAIGSSTRPLWPETHSTRTLGCTFLKGSIMSNKLYVGNLSYSVRDDDLQQHFSAFGQVQSAKVMMERDTGRSKGFGFVEMASPAEAEAAIQGLHGKNMAGRDLTVNIARPMEARPPRSDGFGGGGGGGYNGGGYNGGGRRSSY